MTSEISHDARSVANEILSKPSAFSIDHTIEIHELIKLVYFAHGWSLAIYDIPLVSQSPEAWTFGPVYPDIYYPLSKYKDQPITTRIINDTTGLEYKDNFSDNQNKIIDFVLTRYQKYYYTKIMLFGYDKSKNERYKEDTTQNIYNQESMPWRKALKRGKFSPISNDDMKKYFDILAISKDINSKNINNDIKSVYCNNIWESSLASLGKKCYDPVTNNPEELSCYYELELGANQRLLFNKFANIKSQLQEMDSELKGIKENLEEKIKKCTNQYSQESKIIPCCKLRFSVIIFCYFLFFNIYFCINIIIDFEKYKPLFWPILLHNTSLLLIPFASFFRKYGKNHEKEDDYSSLLRILQIILFKK